MVFPGGHEANADDPVQCTWNGFSLLGWERLGAGVESVCGGIAWSNHKESLADYCQGDCEHVEENTITILNNY